METGVLPLYAQLLEPERPTDNSEEEQILATKGLWTLAFKISTRQKITEMPELMAKLRRLSSGETGADAVKQAARGALWILEEKDEQQRALSAGKPQSREPVLAHTLKKFGIESFICLGTRNRINL